jgi:hypothetical protein
LHSLYTPQIISGSDSSFSGELGLKRAHKRATPVGTEFRRIYGLNVAYSPKVYVLEVLKITV